jgi:tricorn protease
MLREAWRLQRDHFWTPDMGGVDWQEAYRRYLPLIARVATRAEFSDLMWELQGELGTSHAYELGGDYRPEPVYAQGFLGADLSYQPESESYVVQRLVRGDLWDEETASPLARVGVGVQPGDRLLAVDGQRLGRDRSPAQALVNRAGAEVALRFAPREGEETPYLCTVRCLDSETPARYRDWVEANRRQVHASTDGRVGYLHIPDMGAGGYAEFHRGFLAELHRDGLVVDVRYNSGGHVSQLILEKLARRRLGYDVQRWGEPVPYPLESLGGPIVLLINEQTGSDGDMFSHAFKLMRLGLVIGTRSWGGVIGIRPRESFVDGGIATQPEFSLWFKDVGFGVENQGTTPDREVECRPQDHAAGLDPQLDAALEEIQRLLREAPPEKPSFGDRPRLPLPGLPGVEP